MMRRLLDGMGGEEFEVVARQSGARQVEWFVERCVESGRVWGLSVGGADWAMTSDPDGLELFAVWSDERLAAACRHLHWANREPTSLRVGDFLDLVIPKLTADGVALAVLPRPDLRCTVVHPAPLRRALERALLRLEWS